VKKSLISLIVLLNSIILFAGSSSSPSYTCNTKYPIVFVHGVNTNSDSVNFAIKLMDRLEENGAKTYRTFVTAWDSTHNKGVQWRAEVLRILAISGASKINVIAHSNGVIYARYAVTNLGLGNKIASMTLMCGPNRGTEAADIALKILPTWVEPVADQLFAWIFPADVNGSISQNAYDLTTSYMQNVFNPNTPDVAGIYYQSYGAKIKFAALNSILEPLWLLILPFGGANDGIIPTYSAPWTNFKGILTGAWWGNGLDHLDIISGETRSGWGSDDFFINIAIDLKSKGL